MQKLALNFTIATLMVFMAINIQAKPKPLLSIAYNNQVIRTQLLDILERSNDSELSYSAEEAYVHFTINTMNEIVILATGTTNPELDAFIKSRLNYERIEAKNILFEQDYFIKLTFQKSDNNQAMF